MLGSGDASEPCCREHAWLQTLLPYLAVRRTAGVESGRDDRSVYNLSLLSTGRVWQPSSSEDLQCPAPIVCQGESPVEGSLPTPVHSRGLLRGVD